MLRSRNWDGGTADDLDETIGPTMPPDAPPISLRTTLKPGDIGASIALHGTLYPANTASIRPSRPTSPARCAELSCGPTPANGCGSPSAAGESSAASPSRPPHCTSPSFAGLWSIPTPGRGAGQETASRGRRVLPELRLPELPSVDGQCPGDRRASVSLGRLREGGENPAGCGAWRWSRRSTS